MQVVQTKVVIVGAGMIGASIAYHLAKLGWRDIILVDKGNLYENDGSTSHAPGGVAAINHSKLMADFAQYSTKLYAELPEFNQFRRTHNPVGSFELARTDARWADMKRLHSAAQSYGIETHLLTAKEVQEQHWNMINPQAFKGVLHIPNSCLVSGAGASGSLLLEAERIGGAKAYPNTTVTDMEIVNGRVRALLTNNPEMARIECEYVILATNIWGPVLGDKIGMAMPLLAFEHHYTYSEPMDELSQFDPTNRDHEAVLPLIRDLDVTMYYRHHWNKLGVGSYYHRPLPVNPYDLPKTAIKPFTPEDYIEARKLADEMMPAYAGKQLQHAINGMFAFSVDGYPIMGEMPTVKGVWACVASWITHAGGVGKALAEWMVYGESEKDLRACDVNRFHAYQTTRNYIMQITQCNYTEVYDIVHPRKPTTLPRNVRYSPFHERNVELGGHLVPAAGIEVPNWYESNAPLLEKYADQIPPREGWAAQYWSPIQAVEHFEVRNNVGVFDLTALSIIEVKGSGAVKFVNWLCTNEMDRPVGSVIYTCWLTPKGGIKRDLAVARMSEDSYWMFVGEGSINRDMAWVRAQAPQDSSVQVNNVSALYSALGIWGPNARKVMEKVTADDMSHEGFPYYGGRWIEIGSTRVYAMRISYVGELGWELHIPTDQSLPVWDMIWEAGREFEMVAVGAACMDTLRFEKGYRLWGGDIYTEYNVYQAGLSWTARFKKEGGFIGREATLAAKDKLKKKLCCLAIEGATTFGYEPVYAGDAVISHIMTSNYGYSYGKQLAFAYLPLEYAVEGTALEVGYFAERYAATVISDPVYDQGMERLKM